MLSLYKTSLKIGFSGKKISTKRKVDLGGYGYYLSRVSTEILDDIYTKALFVCIEDNAVLFIANDLIGLTPKFARSVAQEISRKTKIPQKNILLSCTHTHSAPATAALEGCGKIDNKYLQEIKTKIVENALETTKNLQPATVKFKNFTIESFSFNKAFPKRTRRDQDVLLLSFETTSNKILLAQFSTHPSILNNKSTVISKDFVNAFYWFAEKNGCDDLIFFTGACGDILASIIQKNASTKSTSDSFVSKAQFDKEILVLKEKLGKQDKKSKWERIVIEQIKVLTKNVTLKFDIPPFYEDEDKMKRYFENIFYDEIDLEKGLIKAVPETKDLHVISKEKRAKGVQGIISTRFSQFRQQLRNNNLEFSRGIEITVILIADLIIVALPFEVTNNFENTLRSLYPKLLVFCYTNGLEGYIYSPDESTSYPRTRGSLLYNLFPFERFSYNKLLDATKGLIRSNF